MLKRRDEEDDPIVCNIWHYWIRSFSSLYLHLQYQTNKQRCHSICDKIRPIIITNQSMHTGLRIKILL